MTDEYGVKSPGGFVFVVDNLYHIRLSIAPLIFVLHPIATFEMVVQNKCLITFLFVHLSVSPRSLTHLLVRALTPFRPASGIDI